jgi:hypothetical protein
MGEIAVNHNSTIVLPVPIDLLRPFVDCTNGPDGTHHATRREEEEAERLYEEAVGDISPETSTDANPRRSALENRTYLTQKSPQH